MLLAQFCVSIVCLFLLFVSFNTFDDRRYPNYNSWTFSDVTGVIGMVICMCNAVLSIITYGVIH